MGEPLRVALLALVVGVVYANAWYGGLVYDDKLFADYRQFADLSTIPRYFVDHVWAERSIESGLYRPMLFISVGLDAWLFGDNFAAYHLVNVLYHLVVTLLVYGFLKAVLVLDERTRSSAVFSALLAAVAYAAHPILSEVVNSVFNRSNMLAAMGMVGGLWLLISHVGTRPWLAWSGLLLAYTFALFSRETAIVLPGLAALLLFIYTTGTPGERLRRSLPVLVLIVPMVFYLALRANALSGGELGPVVADGAARFVNQLDASRLLQPAVMLDVAGTMAQGMVVFLWPFQHRLFYADLSVACQWAGLLAHLGLLATAGILYRRGRKGLLTGLAFYYLAFLPASRLIGAGSVLPHLHERYLYVPSIGLILILAYGIAALRERFDAVLSSAPVVLFVLLAVPVGWARNAQWSDELTLFQTEYVRGGRGGVMLRLLTAAHLREGEFGRVMEICDANGDLIRARYARVSAHCGSAYSYSGRSEDAERAYLAATRDPNVRTLAYSNLAQHELRLGRWQEAKSHFEQAVESETGEARRAYRTGYMLVHLYPDDRQRLVEARSWFAKAARLEPQWRDPRAWLNRLDAGLGISDATEEP